MLLLGGPNSFIRGMREAWQANIPRMWQERKVAVPEGSKPEDLIKVRRTRSILPRLGAIEFGRRRGRLRRLLSRLRESWSTTSNSAGRRKKPSPAARAWSPTPVELDDFPRILPPQEVHPSAPFRKASTVGGFIGIDGGSTSTKAVLLDENGDILCKSYQLSNGNPIQDTIEMFENLRGQVEAQNAQARSAGRRNHWLRQGYSERCSEGRCRAWSKPWRTPNPR